MPSKIEELDDYIMVTLTGEALPPVEIKKYITTVIRLCEKKNKHCLIYRSEYAKQTSNTIDFFKLSKYWAKQSFWRRKHAMVFPEKSIVENIRFMETAAYNRGVNVMIFESISEAEKWLKE